MKRILVVDDDAILRMIICDALDKSAFHIDEASDGMEALKMLQQNDYQLVIIDYIMPSMTGVEVMGKVPEQKKVDMHVLMLTAKTHDTDRQAALAAGVAYFMLKPFNPNDLVQVATDILTA